MEKQQKKCPPNIIKSNNALKLAEQWVNNMSEGADDEQIEVEGRPSRLGLGAKVSRQTKIGPLNDPLEKKLYAKFDGRTKSRATEESTLSTPKKDERGNDSDDSEDLESRTQVFDKKRTANPLTTLVQTKKKKW